MLLKTSSKILDTNNSCIMFFFLISACCHSNIQAEQAEVATLPFFHIQDFRWPSAPFGALHFQKNANLTGEKLKKHKND